MLQKVNKSKLLTCAVLIGLLIAVRAFEDQIFYDPFLAYFRGNYTNEPLPAVSPVKLFLSIGFRYYLNSILSIGLLHVLFGDARITKFSILLYAFFGTVLMIAFFFMMLKLGGPNKMYLFYVRRFLIHPVLLLLFVPAFYYQKRIK